MKQHTFHILIISLFLIFVLGVFLYRNKTIEGYHWYGYKPYWRRRYRHHGYWSPYHYRYYGPYYRRWWYWY